MFRMDELMTFERGVTLIVSHLANAVKAEMFRVLSGQNNTELEDRLVSLVDALCAEAVDKILRLVHETPHLYDVTQQNSDPAIVTQTSGGEDDVRDPVSSDHTYILVSEKDESKSTCVLVSLQSLVFSSDQTKISCSEKIPEVTTVSTPQAKAHDHEYAQPLPSLPPPTDSSEHTDVRIRKRRKKSDTAVQAVHCSRCKMLFPNAERLSLHQKRSHPECSVCGEIFTGMLRLRDHEMKEHGLLPYTCDFCAKRFNHKAHRDLHVKARHTGEKSCHCDICGKGYACVSLMKTHRVTHFDKTFICDVCGKCFYHACHLTRHKLVHQKVRPYQCATCGKGCTQASNLRSHEAVHTGERQLCAVCGKSYRCLKNHVISKHPHELPDAVAVVVCSGCGKKFANHSQLRVHQRSHTGEKPFPCATCGKSFCLKEVLRDHQLTHTDQKPYTCTLCRKTFTLATSFMRHRSIHSGETPHSCRVCGKQFRLLSFLKAHLQTKAHLQRAQQKSTDLEQRADTTETDEHACHM